MNDVLTRTALILQGGQRELDTSGWANRVEARASGDAELRNSEMSHPNGTVMGGDLRNVDTEELDGHQGSHSLPTPEEHVAAGHRRSVGRNNRRMRIAQRVTGEVRYVAEATSKSCLNMTGPGGILRSRALYAALTALFILTVILAVSEEEKEVKSGGNSRVSSRGSDGGTGDGEEVKVPSPPDALAEWCSPPVDDFCLKACVAAECCSLPAAECKVLNPEMCGNWEPLCAPFWSHDDETGAGTVVGEGDRESDIMVILEVISGIVVSDPSSPQGIAARWIATEDRLHLSADSPYLAQRYALAVFYHALDGEHAMGSDLWNTGRFGEYQPWLSGDAGECAWSGISCDGDARVTEVVLEKMGLKGEIPPEIRALKELVVLDLSQNDSIEGVVPIELGELKKLSELPFALLWYLPLLYVATSAPSGSAPFDLLLTSAQSYSCLLIFFLADTLILDSTSLEGPVPTDVCDLKYSGSLKIFLTNCELVFCNCCDNCSEESSAYLPPPGGSGGDDLPDDKQGPPDIVSGLQPMDPENHGHNESFSTPRGKAILSQIQSLSPYSATQVGTPQYAALEWLVHTDTMELNSMDADLVQRYVVAVLYYSLGGVTWLYPGWLNGKRDECRFPGMVCNGKGRITTISLGECDANKKAREDDALRSEGGGFWEIFFSF